MGQISWLTAQQSLCHDQLSYFEVFLMHWSFTVPICLTVILLRTGKRDNSFLS